MKWYAAHLILYVKFKEGPQDRFPFWENIVLVSAETESEAWDKAEARGREGEGDCSGTFRWGGRPSCWVFAGVRQLISCDDPEEQPGDGTEVTYSDLEADSEDDLRKLVRGEPVTIRFPGNEESPDEAEDLREPNTETTDG